MTSIFHQLRYYYICIFIIWFVFIDDLRVIIILYKKASDLFHRHKGMKDASLWLHKVRFLCKNPLCIHLKSHNRGCNKGRTSFPHNETLLNQYICAKQANICVSFFNRLTTVLASSTG